MASASQIGQVNILSAGVVREHAQGVICLTLSEHGVTMVSLPCLRAQTNIDASGDRARP